MTTAFAKLFRTRTARSVMFLSMIVGAVFFLPKFANAEEIQLIAQTNFNTYDTMGFSGIGQKLGTGLYGNLSSVSVYMAANQNGDEGFVYTKITCFDDSDYEDLCNGGVSGFEFVTSHVMGPSTTAAGQYLLTYADDVILDSTKYYRLDVLTTDYNVFGGNGVRIYGSSSNDFVDGEANGGSVVSLVDMYFVLNIDSPVFFANPPFSYEMETNDFQNWRVCFAPSGIPYENYSFIVQYGVTLTDYEDDYSENLLTNEITTFNCDTLVKNTDLTPGNYVARVGLYINEIPFAQSPILPFTVVAGEQTVYPTDYSDVDENTFECSDGNIFYIGLCNAFRFLFIPGENSTNLANGAYEDLSGTFPFAYVTDVYGVMTDLDEGSGSAATLTVDFSETALPIGGAEGVELFSEDTIESLAGSSTVSLFRGLMAAALWVGMGFYVFHRAGGLH